MTTIRNLLQEADPLEREPTCSPGERARQRHAILAASLTQVPFHERSRPRWAPFVAFGLILAVASVFDFPTDSPFVGELQAAVRFEVRLAERTPAPGLREVKRSGSEPPVYVHEEVVVTNSDISSARVLPGAAPGQFAVGVEFNASGAAKMRQATAGHIGRPVAILIDGEVVMAPLLRAPIGASAVVTGNFSKAEAERIVSGVQLR